MTARASKRRSATGRDWLIVLAAVTVVAIGATLLSARLFDNAKSERIAAEASNEIRVQSIYDDRIKGALDPDYDSARYHEIATSLHEDPVYFDGYPGFDIDESDVASIRAEIARADSPVYVAFLSATDLDDADGDLDLLAARIVMEMDDTEAAVLTVNAYGLMGLAEKGRIRPTLAPLSKDVDDSDSRAALKGVREVSSAETRDSAEAASYRHDAEGNPKVTKEDTAQDPHDLEYSTGGALGAIVLGIMFGAGLGVGIVLITRALRKRTAQQ